MYAVIRTGGKQYRVQPGDLVVVEKLDGEPGAAIAFDQVLMIGDGPAVTVGAPIIAGASVSATLVETRKGKKIKVFKKIRRQGYRRTRGHRQFESVLRITALSGDGRDASWDGEVDLTPLAVLNARARNLARGMEAAAAAKEARPAAEPKAAKVKAKAAAKKAAAKKAAPKKIAPKKVAAKKADGEKPSVAEAAAPAAKAPAAKKPAPKKAAAEKPVKKAVAKKAEAKGGTAAKPKPKPKAAKAKSAKD